MNSPALGRASSCGSTSRQSGSAMNSSESAESSSSQLCLSGGRSSFPLDTTLPVVSGQKLLTASAPLLAHLPPSRAGRALENLWAPSCSLGSPTQRSTCYPRDMETAWTHSSNLRAARDAHSECGGGDCPIHNVGRISFPR